MKNLKILIKDNKKKPKRSNNKKLSNLIKIKEKN